MEADLFQWHPILTSLIEVQSASKANQPHQLPSFGDYFYAMTMSRATTRVDAVEVADDTDGATATLTTADNKVLGFTHFRYEPNDDDESSTPTQPITYLYELQIHPTLQKLGMGKRLMTIVELLSFKCHMEKVMLTVFKMNDRAMGFYLNKMKYGVDECSPSNYEGCEDCDYEILSKSLVGGAGG